MSKLSEPKILLIGSSWQASVLLDAIKLASLYTVVGFLDDTLPAGALRNGYAVLGGMKDAPRICSEHAVSDVAMAIGDNWWRRKLYTDLIATCPGLRFPVIRHPSTIVAASARVGKGTAILAGSHVGPNSIIGDFCILNTSSSIDHDCTLADFSSIAPGVKTGGLVRIGECTSIGVGASISDRISIGSHSVVGTGAAVVRDIPDFVVAYGNPARVKRSRGEGERYVDTQQRSL